MNQDGLFSKKLTTYRGLVNRDGAYILDYDDLSYAVRPFFEFADYSEKHDETPEKYTTGEDFNDALLWSPSHCIKSFDYNRPKVAAPIIGIIGAQS